MSIISVPEQLIRRSVLIHAFPPPRSLLDTRAILATVQRFGEVVAFRSLKYDLTNKSPHKGENAVVVFDSEDAAHAALTASNLKIPLNKGSSSFPPRSSSSSTADAQHTTTHDLKPISDSLNSAEDTNALQNLRYMNLYLRPYHFAHVGSVRRNVFHTAFKKPDHEGAIQKDLIDAGLEKNLLALADVPASRKENLTISRKEKVHDLLIAMGSASLMDLWKDGIAAGKEKAPKESIEKANAEEDIKSDQG
ncbi:hypothetical protein BJX64DRAFT_118696 [Aspergillus heterothallicus]